MKRSPIAILPVCLCSWPPPIRGAGVPEFRDLFNGKDLAGWVNVNTAADTWRVENGMLVCSGHPIGVMRNRPAIRELRPARGVDAHRTGRQLRHVPVERTACPTPAARFPNGVEVQMLELEWPNLNKKDGKTPPVAYVHGELFGVGQVKTVPDNPRGERSMSDRKPLQGARRMEHLRRGCRRRRPQTLGQRQIRQWHQPYHAEEGLHLHGVRGRQNLLPQHSDYGIAARGDVRGTVRSAGAIASPAPNAV